MPEKHLRVRNWERYQHYKQRRPPWIKFYAELLDDDEICTLDYASRLFANLILLVASRDDNVMTTDARRLAQRVGMEVEAVEDAVANLLSIRFLELATRKRPASKMLDERLQEASNGASNGLAERYPSRAPAGSHRDRDRERKRTTPPTPSSPRPTLAPGEVPAVRTSCPVCDCHLDQRVRDAAFIYDQELTRRVYEHLVNVHRWEEDRALDIAVKTAGTPWAPPPDDGINPFLDEKEGDRA